MNATTAIKRDALKPITIEDIQTAAVIVDVGRDKLGTAARAYEKALTKLRNEHTPQIRALIETLRTDFDSLLDLVRAAPDLFTKPKSFETSGLKVGYRKGKGSVEFKDADKLVSRLKALQRLKVLSRDTVDGVITVKVRVSKSALGKLDANILKRLGVDVKAGQDEAFVQPIDSEVEKMVKQLFGEDSEEEG